MLILLQLIKVTQWAHVRSPLHQQFQSVIKCTVICVFPTIYWIWPYLYTVYIIHTHTHVHTQKTHFSNHRASISKGRSFSHSSPDLLLVFCNWLSSRHSGGQQARRRRPSRPIDLSSAHRVKAEGMRERGCRGSPSFLWQPAGACLGLFPVSSDCFSFCQGAEPWPLREGEAKCRRHLEEHVTATGFVDTIVRPFYW